MQTGEHETLEDSITSDIQRLRREWAQYQREVVGARRGERKKSDELRSVIGSMVLSHMPPRRKGEVVDLEKLDRYLSEIADELSAFAVSPGTDVDGEGMRWENRRVRDREPARRDGLQGRPAGLGFHRAR